MSARRVIKGGLRPFMKDWEVVRDSGSWGLAGPVGARFSALGARATCAWDPSRGRRFPGTRSPIARLPRLMGPRQPRAPRSQPPLPLSDPSCRDRGRRTDVHDVQGTWRARCRPLDTSVMWPASQDPVTTPRSWDAMVGSGRPGDGGSTGSVCLSLEDHAALMRGCAPAQPESATHFAFRSRALNCPPPRAQSVRCIFLNPEVQFRAEDRQVRIKQFVRASRPAQGAGDALALALALLLRPDFDMQAAPAAFLVRAG